LKKLEFLRKVETLPEFSEGWVPSYKTGVILSGEKLLADGSLPQMQLDYSERVRVCEMEGSGFASACDEYSIPWLIFRGISDFGDPEKPTVKRWQPVAALAAATCLAVFVNTHYRLRREKQF